MNIAFMWVDPTYDADFLAAVNEAADRFRRIVASEQGALYENSPRYNNYAIYETPLSSIYGENLRALQKLKKRYDPKRVMNLAGGWKL
jgi:FAD/FMN-containing dehydrogenase